MLGVDTANVIGNASTSGTIHWTFDSGSEAFNHLAVGETLVLGYTLRATDSAGGRTDQVVTVTVVGSNDSPQLSGSGGVGTVTELMSPPIGNLLDSGVIAFSDIDLSDVHSVSVAANGSALGVLTAQVDTDAAGNGVVSWHYSVNAAAVEFLAAGETRVDSFVVSVSDGHGGSAGRMVNVTINGSNDTLVVGTTGLTGAVTEAAAGQVGNLSDGATFTFTDADTSSHHSISVTAVGSPLGSMNAVLTADTAGSGVGGAIRWDYSVDPAAVEYLAAGETRLEQFTISITDGQGGRYDQIVSVTVTGTNGAPVISVLGSDSASADLTETDSGLAVSGTLTVTDQDLSDTVVANVVSVSATGATNGMTNNDLLAMLSVNAGPVKAQQSTSGQLTWTFDSGLQAFNHLAVGETLALRYTVRATDGSLASADQTVLVTITGTNDAPVANADDAVAPDGRPVSIAVLANDSDVDANTALSVTRINGTAVASGGTVTLVQGSVTLSADGALTFAPTPGINGEVGFSYEVSDGAGGTASAQVTVMVSSAGVIVVPPPPDENPNDAPPPIPLPQVIASEPLVLMPLPMLDVAHVQTAVREAQAELGATDALTGGADPRVVQVAEVRSLSINSGIVFDPALFVQNIVRSSQGRAAHMHAMMSSRHGVLSLSSDQLIATPSIFVAEARHLHPTLFAQGADAPPATIAAPAIADPVTDALDLLPNAGQNIVDHPPEAPVSDAAPDLNQGLATAVNRPRLAARSFSDQLRDAARSSRLISNRPVMPQRSASP
jgi:VCBS repeat-containing protein